MEGLTYRRIDTEEFVSRIDDIVQLCLEPLGWRSEEPNREFLLWKHVQNPFGPSAVWFAEDEGALVGVRMMMRWSFRRPDGSLVEVARAVDTATASTHQRRGIFSSLTKMAVEELTAEGVEGIFNTPNGNSRPGYLKLGWTTLGQVRLAVRPRSPKGIRRASTSAPRQRWGLQSSQDLAPEAAFADGDALPRLLESVAPRTAMSTAFSPEYLRWRYGFEPLGYRAVLLGDGGGNGLIVYRLRQRGERTELAVSDGFVPKASRPRAWRRLAQSAQLNGADAIIGAGPGAPSAFGLVPLPRSGPTLVWRSLAVPDRPSLGDLSLSLGTLELF